MVNSLHQVQVGPKIIITKTLCWHLKITSTYRALQFKVVYDWNHNFGLGLISKPKPKLANTFGRYRSWYQNHILKGKSSIFLILKGPFKPNLLPNIQDFQIIFDDL